MRNGRFMWTAVASVAVLIVFAGLPAGQSAPENPADPVAPVAPDQMGIWLNTIGKWQGSLAFMMGGDTIPGVIQYEFRSFADSFGVSLEEVIEVPVAPAYRAMSLVGWDQTEKRYHMYTVDNYRDVHDHFGHLTEDSVVAFEWQGMHNGKQVIERYTMRLGNEEMTFDLNRTSDGTLIDEYSAVLTRAK